MHPEARGRYAPSPTGRLHLGNARTALLAWLQIRAMGGRFVLRIEDLDPERSRPEYERWILEDLRWLGLDWDEGPDVGGPHGSYRQSERGEQYRAALQTLEVFPCTCTRRELRDAPVAPHGREPVYPGHCRHGVRAPERRAALRWRTPAETVRYVDAVLGQQTEDVLRETGEFVLRRGDGAWAYQLAVVVDDAAMGITHVLRGADLLGCTARQILLQRKLGYRIPTYAHVPLVLGPDGQKLNKRHEAPDLGMLRAAGVDPRQVVSRLAASAGLLPDGATWRTPQELVPGFSLETVRRHASPRLDTEFDRPTSPAMAHSRRGL